MKIGKMLLAALVVGILEMAWGWLTCGWLFNWVYRIEPVNIWKLGEEIPFVLMNVSTLVFAFLLAMAYNIIRKGLPGRGVFAKGLLFGLIVWIVGALPGIGSMAMFTTIAPVVIIYWLINAFVANIWKGIIIAAIVR
ncbi:MAG: hypothetical protein ABH836_01435 [Candidatus Omnitrophota bacterium]